MVVFPRSTPCERLSFAASPPSPRYWYPSRNLEVSEHRRTSAHHFRSCRVPRIFSSPKASLPAKTAARQPLTAHACRFFCAPCAVRRWCLSNLRNNKKCFWLRTGHHGTLPGGRKLEGPAGDARATKVSEGNSSRNPTLTLPQP